MIIKLPFDFGEQVFVFIGGRIIETKVKSYTVLNDKIVVNTINGAFDSEICFKSPDDINC